MMVRADLDRLRGGEGALMRVLVTGIGGFAGPVVAGALRAAGHEVLGLVQRGAAADRARRARRSRAAALHVGRRRATPPGSRACSRRRGPTPSSTSPALTFVARRASAIPREPTASTSAGTLALLGGRRARRRRRRASSSSSSSDVYGAGRARASCRSPRRRRSGRVTVYGASKAAADLAAAQWARAYGLRRRARAALQPHRPGAGRRRSSAARFARQVAAIEAGTAGARCCASATSTRCATSPTCATSSRGYVALLERGRAGEAYNLCSGEGASVAEVIAILRTHARVPVRVRPRSRRCRRAADVAAHRREPRAGDARHGLAAAHPARRRRSARLLDDWRARLRVG